MSLLIIGGTGTLGSQIVRQALDNGYNVRCLVRNLRKAKFLREWGADLIKADLTKPETLTGAFEGIKIVIDASAARPGDPFPAELVDLKGKRNLIRVAKTANIKQFISFSVINNEKYLHIPLMKMKYLIENELKESNLPYTIFQIPAFFQGLIGQYGIPLLEDNEIVVIDETNAIPYIDAQDVAKFTLKSLEIEATKNEVFKLCGPKAWLSRDIISLCEGLSGQKAKTRVFSLLLINLSKNLSSFFEWSWPIANRLLFIEVFKDLNVSNEELNKVFTTFNISNDDFSNLDDYFKEYFEKILQDLQKLNFQKPKDLIL